MREGDSEGVAMDGHEGGMSACGVLMRLVATSGTDTAPLSLCVTHEKPARGTHLQGEGVYHRT